MEVFVSRDTAGLSVTAARGRVNLDDNDNNDEEDDDDVNDDDDDNEQEEEEEEEDYVGGVGVGVARSVLTRLLEGIH